MYRTSNNWLLKCKLNGNEQSLPRDFVQLEVRIAQDVAAWASRQGWSSVQSEIAAGRAALIARAQVSRCSAFVVTPQYIRFWMLNAYEQESREATSQAVTGHIKEQSPNHLAPANVEMSAPPWLNELWQLLTFSRRGWLYHDLMTQRKEIRGSKRQLAKVYLGKSSRQTNFSRLFTDRKNLQDELIEAMPNVVLGFVQNSPVLELLAQLHQDCRKIEFSHREPDDLMVVARLICKLRSTWAQNLELKNHPHLGNAIWSIYSTMESFRLEDDLQASNTDYAEKEFLRAVEESWQWMNGHSDAAQVATSATLAWLERLQPDFRNERPASQVLSDVVRESLNWSTAVEPKLIHEQDTSLTSYNHRTSLQNHLMTSSPVNSPGRCVTALLIQGKTFQEIRETPGDWILESTEISNKTWEEIRRRLEEWFGWITRKTRIGRKQQCNGWIEEEIPPSVFHQPMRLCHVIESLQTVEYIAAWKAGHLSSLDFQIVTWGLFSVTLDQNNARMHEFYWLKNRRIT